MCAVFFGVSWWYVLVEPGIPSPLTHVLTMSCVGVRSLTYLRVLAPLFPIPFRFYRRATLVASQEGSPGVGEGPQDESKRLLGPAVAAPGTDVGVVEVQLSGPAITVPSAVIVPESGEAAPGR
jgi:hypothetical protein